MPEQPDTDVLDDATRAWGSLRDDVAPIRGVLAMVAVVLLGVEAVVGVWLRFSAPSLLWLDESLTVNIARLPLGSLHQALKEDGAPPLYYLLLHLWIAVFGSSDLAVRSLSGVLSCATVMVVFLLVRRVWGRETALVSVALLLGSSFAIYYATETRMYSLVMLLCALGGLALVRLFERPCWQRMVPVAVALIALEYTHYWSVYLFAALGILSVLAAWRGSDERVRLAGRWTIGAFVVAAVAFLPWLPTFLYQSKHTGTPWGGAPNFTTVLVAVFHFNYNQVRQIPRSGLAQRAAELLMLGLMALSLFAVARGTRWISLRWPTVPRARVVAWLSVGTIVLGVAASHFSKAAFAPRYASVAYVPLLIFLALGTRALGAPVLRVIVIAALCTCTLAVAIQQRSTPRTQAAEVVHAIVTRAPAGSLIVFCPDQLGPSVMRILPANRFGAVGYPRFNDPHFVNWVDYDKALLAANPSAAAIRLGSLARGRPIVLVTAAGYAQAGYTCAAVRTSLNQAFPSHATWVLGKNAVYFQSMTVVAYKP